MRNNEASRTARGVAIGRAVGVDGIRDHVVAHLLGRRDRLAVRAWRTLPATRPAVGLAAHAALRMHAVDRAVVAAVAAIDPATVIVVGAGWDTRAWRLPALRGRRLVEVDHPATQRAKRARADRIPAPEAELVFAPADLRVDDLEEVVERTGQDPAAPTVWIWEAVWPYLPAEAVDQTLAVMARRSAPDSRLVATTMPPGLLRPLVPPAAIAALLGLHVAGEPIRTAESDMDVARRLARHQWVGGGGSTGPREWAAAADVDLFGPVLDERLHVVRRDGA